MATINGVEVIGDKTAHDYDLLDKDDGINLANGVERNREATEDNHQDIVLHRTDTDVHVTPEWKNSLVSKETLGLYWTAAQTADIINEISIAGGAKLVKVDELPETGKEQTIYLVPKTDPLERDIFDEYVWIDGKYEFIGTTKVDLSNYATKAELNAKANTSDLTIHTNNTDIHVTTADKNKWNGKQDALSNQQLSNIADVANKANDDDVVHKTGNESVGGIKTFNDLQIVSYGTQYKGSRDAYILPEFAAEYSGLSINTLSFSQTLKIGNFVLDANNKPALDITKGYIQIATGENNNVNTCLIEPRNCTASSLGTSTNKWETINGLNPGALSLPGNYVTVDTTDWVLNGTSNHFVPTSDGWFGIQCTDTVYNQTHYVFVGRTGGSSYYQQNTISPVNALWDSKYHGSIFIPVIKGFNYDIRCICSAIVATFYPCQGNV